MRILIGLVTDELCEHCYPDTRPIERKHQVSAPRAAWNVIKHDPDWRCMAHHRMGGGMRSSTKQTRRAMRSCGIAITLPDIIYRSEKRHGADPANWVWIRRPAAAAEKSWTITATSCPIARRS